MKFDELTFMLIKTDCTNQFSLPKLSENNPLQVSNINDDDRNNYQATFTFMFQETYWRTM